MRTIVVLMLLAAGCGDEPMEMLDAGMCTADCPACATGETCLRGDGDHVGACLKRCLVQADCASGLKCEQLYGMGDFVCASQTLPSRCSTGAFTASCSDLVPYCKDAATLVQGFSYVQNATCGFVLMPCAHTCDPGGAGADGGATPPHCT